jgi:hypothetical protein
MLKHEKKKWEKQPKIKRTTSFLRPYTAGVQAVAGIHAGEGGVFEICVQNESRYMGKEEGQREEGRGKSLRDEERWKSGDEKRGERGRGKDRDTGRGTPARERNRANIGPA